MTLRLLGSLRWEPDGQAARAWPVVLPAAILLVLARQGQWQSRVELADLFWPDLHGDAALLNLRVNVHKARRLLVGLGIDVPLEADRRRLRWAPPIDLLAGSDARGPLATGFDLPEFESFEAWLRDWREDVAPPAPHARAAGAAADPRPDAQAVVDASPGFHGRRVELAWLRSSTTSVVVAAGEAGIGKSRLVAQAFEGGPWLRCREGLRQFAFGAVAELFGSQPAWLQDLGTYRLDLARLLPDIAPDEPLPPLDAITARVRLFEGLARAAEHHAPLLLVDDLQWADPTTLEWLVLLAHRGRLRWIATARDDELPANVGDALQSLEAAGTATVLQVGGLDRGALDALLHERRPDLAGPRRLAQAHPWLQALYAYTGGNAFCAVEVMDALEAGDRSPQLAQLPLPDRVAGMLRRRRDRLTPSARAVVDAAALAVGRPSLAQLAAVSGLDRAATVAAVECAQGHGLMQDTTCRHDLVRQALRSAMPAARAAELHRRSALHLADEGAEPEAVAYHWRCAGDDEAAWPHVLRAAQRLRQRGEHDAAVAALTELRDAARDQALALRAEVMLAQEHLFDDLQAGRAALEATLFRAGCLPPGMDRSTLEAQALAGLIDNAVFSGDLAHAHTLLPELQARLPGLARETLIEAHQVLIEATMREGDFQAARSSLEGLRQARAARPVVLSFAGQIHWFSGSVRDARQVFEQLLAQHPDYCHGLTIENDLAVMCHALGELERAEDMARRSLRSWVGVPHTEALSRLVLGATLLSRGCFDEAREVLDQALRIGRQQGSDLFAGEALTRLARLHWCAGEVEAARSTTAHARQLVGKLTEPLRASALALMEVLCRTASDDVVETTTPCPARMELADLCTHSAHPLVHARRWRAELACAQQAGDRAAACDSARQMLSAALSGSLAEWQCESLWLLATLDSGAPALAARRQAQEIARQRGFAALTDGPYPWRPPAAPAQALATLAAHGRAVPDA